MKDPSDAKAEIEKRLHAAESKYKADVELVGQSGGTVPTLALQRWRSAKWVEVEIVGH